MKKLLTTGLAIIMAVGLLTVPVLADQTMDQIQKTGKIKLGFREGSIPFAFVDPKVGKHVGFSVDMAGELAKYLGMRFGKKIEIVPFTVTPKTRIPMVVNGTVDVDNPRTHVLIAYHWRSHVLHVDMHGIRSIVIPLSVIGNEPVGYGIELHAGRNLPRYVAPVRVCREIP